MGCCWSKERQEELELSVIAGEATGQTVEQTAGQTAEQAVEQTEQTVEHILEQIAGQTLEQTVEKTGQTGKKTEEQTGQKVEQTGQMVEQTVEQTGQMVEQTVEQKVEQTGQTVERTRQTVEKTGETVEQTGQMIEQSGQMVEQTVEQKVEQIRQMVERTRQTVEKTGQTVEQTGQMIEQSGQMVEQTVEQTRQMVEQTRRTGQTEQMVEQTGQTGQTVEQTGQKVEQTGQTVEQTGQKVEQTGQTLEQTAGQTVERKLDFDELKEELDVTIEKRTSFCDLCLYNDIESEFGERFVRVVRKVEGVFICYGCKLTLCENCAKGHESHKLCLHKESEERERVREVLINSLMKEDGREDKLEEENMCMYDRVNVKHELDKKDCRISGFCGLDNTLLVVCDRNNDCIKIFQCGSNVLLRYIRIGSEPWDATEIQVKQSSTVPDSASSSNTNISGTDSTKQDKQCLLAVTLPWERHILFIDVNKTPAIKVKTIKMEQECFSIKFCDDRIFTLYDPGYYIDSWPVHVMSPDGVQLSRIRTRVYSRYIPDLAVVPGRFYVTDYENHKVKCIHVDGSRVISEITIEGLWPTGISVDPDHNVYISAPDHNKIYKLDFDLHGPPRPLLLDRSTDYMVSPQALCFYRDKLFVSHHWLSPLRNIVSVVRVV